MTKQEINNLKVGDVLKGNDEWTIAEIFESKKFGKIFTFTKGNNIWTEKEIEESILKLKQQPKKIPYTLETFPENAVWIRNINWKKGEKANFNLREDYNGNIRVWFFDCLNEENFEIDDLKEMENYEIGCQVIKDGKIEIEWLPFYQEI